MSVLSVALVRASNFDSAEPRRCRAVPRPHDLLWLAFAAVRRAPKGPLVARADRVHRIPELSRDSRIRRVLQHAAALAAHDLPANLAAELEVVALVVD